MPSKRLVSVILVRMVGFSVPCLLWTCDSEGPFPGMPTVIVSGWTGGWVLSFSPDLCVRTIYCFCNKEKKISKMIK